MLTRPRVKKQILKALTYSEQTKGKQQQQQ